MENNIGIHSHSLIPIHEENEQYPVNWRELHEKLNVATQYSKWIQRMMEYGFVENQDFQTVVKNVYRADGTVMPTEQVDYNLTLATAKEICMLQRTEQGRTLKPCC